MNLTRFEGEDIDVNSVIAQADTMPFFSDRRLILLEDTGFMKKGSEELAAYLPAMPPETVLLFFENEVDERTKLFKTVARLGLPVRLDHPNREEMEKWVLSRLSKKSRQITWAAMGILLDRVGEDMQTACSEIDKLTAYTEGRDGIRPEDVEAVCCRPVEDRIFDMVRAIGEKRQSKALTLYYDLVELREPPLRILAMIVREFRLMLQTSDLYRQGFDRAEIAGRVGVREFVVSAMLRECDRFSPAQIEAVLEECAAVDEAVKTGRIRAEVGVEMLIVRYSAREERE